MHHKLPGYGPEAELDVLTHLTEVAEAGGPHQILRVGGRRKEGVEKQVLVFGCYVTQFFGRAHQGLADFGAHLHGFVLVKVFALIHLNIYGLNINEVKQ